LFVLYDLQLRLDLRWISLQLMSQQSLAAQSLLRLPLVSTENPMVEGERGFQATSWACIRTEIESSIKAAQGGLVRNTGCVLDGNHVTDDLGEFGCPFSV
jgi:hypothetical protein